MKFRFPTPVSEGDVVAVAAPASPVEKDEVFRAIRLLERRYDVRWTEGICDREFYLAGSDERRRAELANFMSDGDVKAILIARGGYGAMRIVDALPWEVWAASPSWIVGFSDISALHVAANARSVATIHASHVAALGRPVAASADQARLAALSAFLERPCQTQTWSGLAVIRPLTLGEVGEGPVVGGNLALVHAMAAAGRLRVPCGAILVLEDVGERPYRVDRMLTSLQLGGYLDDLGGMVFGGFDQCDPGPDGKTVREVLCDRFGQATFPVLADAPFGHGARNEPFVLGSTARLEGDTFTFSAR